MSIIQMAAKPTDFEQAYSSQSFAAATAIAQQRKQKTMLLATNQQKLMRRRASATHSRPKQGFATGPQCVGHGGGSSSSVSAGPGCCCAIAQTDLALAATIRKRTPVAVGDARQVDKEGVSVGFSYTCSVVGVGTLYPKVCSR